METNIEMTFLCFIQESILSVYGYRCDNAISLQICWYSWISTPMTLESTHMAMINTKQPKSRSKSKTKMELVSTSHLSESFNLIRLVIIVDRPEAWWSGLSSWWFGSSIIAVSAIQSKNSRVGNNGDRFLIFFYPLVR